MGVVGVAVVEDLMAIRDAVTGLAFARVEVTGQPVTGFLGTLDSIDSMIDRWDAGGAATADDHYRLGLLVGMLGYMAACRVDESGVVVPMPVVYPSDNPVAVAANGMRDAVLAFHAPAAGV